MLDHLLDHPAALTATIVGVSALNYAVWALSLREWSRKPHVDMGASPIPPSSRRVELAQHLGMPVAVALLTVSGGRLFTQLSGGYLILQLATLVLNIDAWLHWRILTIAGIVEGRLVPTAEYQYRTLSARVVPLAIFSGAVAAFFGSAAFAFGGLLLCATAIGWYRRARQSRLQPSA